MAEFKKLNPNVPTDPREQLRGAILAVFRSWNNDRAIRYRSYNGIPDEWGTAVSVQVWRGRGVLLKRVFFFGSKCRNSPKTTRVQEIDARTSTPWSLCSCTG